MEHVELKIGVMTAIWYNRYFKSQ